ncbi:MAG TPA: bacteriocin fulvocin C-related protein [Thermoanaerobaculia bacterium]|nr:bacteriocin fulvocin C-related protein [Thermoanaerobaculia bacterium]
MKRSVVPVALVVLFSIAAAEAFAQQIPLRNPRESVVRTFAQLSDAGADGKEMYNLQNADMQADLWLLQIETFLASNPPLNETQRALTMETIGLLSSGALQRMKSPDTEVAARARAEMKATSERNTKAFSAGSRPLFSNLGHDVITTAVAALLYESGQVDTPPQPRQPRPSRLTVDGTMKVQPNWDCNCYSLYDSCEFYPCSPSPGSCTRTPCCCGYLWSDPCNGFCNGV